MSLVEQYFNKMFPVNKIEITATKQGEHLIFVGRQKVSLKEMIAILTIFLPRG